MLGVLCFSSYIFGLDEMYMLVVLCLILSYGFKANL